MGRAIHLKNEKRKSRIKMGIKAKHYLFSIAILTLGMGLGRFIYTGMMPLMFNEGIFDFQALSYIASSNYLGYLFGALLFSFA